MTFFLDCPALESTPGWLSEFKEESILGSCTEDCFTNTDCNENEICCSNECGGHFCFRSKSSSFPVQQRSLCYNADEVIKCFYENVKQKVCLQPSSHALYY